MDILEFFDITNVKHLAAYITLQDTGRWPKNFIPKETKFSLLWYGNLQARMADAYIKEKIGQ